MSNITTSDRTVAFPIRERATAFVPDGGIPFIRATIGVTYPFSEYRIKRSKNHRITLFEYVSEGEGEILIDGEWKRARAGDVYILFAATPHEYRASRTNPWKKIWVNYVADYIGGMLAAYRIAPGVYHIEKARPLFEDLLSFADKKDSSPINAIAISELIHKVVYLIAESTAEKQSDGKDFYRLRAALSARVYEKFSLDKLAEELHLSKSQIIRSFKSLYGVTPYAYFMELKTDTAKILLRDTTMKIKEIADRLSISDEHYFSALFRERVGISPREYRAKRQNR